VLPVGGGLAVFASPKSPMNKVIGLGFDGPLDEAELATVEARWAERGEPVRVELSILSDPAVAATLSGRGYRLQGFENVLARPLDAVDGYDAPDISIAIAGDESYEEWLAIAVDAFASMDGSGSASDPVPPREELERLVREAMGPETAGGMSRYIAHVGGEAAGEAALSVEDGLALLAGSGTRPRYRGRGVQKALVARRLRDAQRAGCDLAVVVTAPGTRSQANVMRRGFDLLYTRAILLR
jgi:GNAT superfamily N-acetyltransferase